MQRQHGVAVCWPREHKQYWLLAGTSLEPWMDTYDMYCGVNQLGKGLDEFCSALGAILISTVRGVLAVALSAHQIYGL